MKIRIPNQATYDALISLSCLLVFALPGGTQAAGAQNSDNVLIVDSVRLFPAKGHEREMLGARFEGSNVSPDDGFVTLGEIKETPAADQWTTLQLSNHTAYRYLRYHAPKGSHCSLAELQFFAGKHLLNGPAFGSNNAGEAPGTWKKAFDGKTETTVYRNAADDQFVGIDLQDQATSGKPVATPGGGSYEKAQMVRLQSRTKGATIILTLDGSLPTAQPKHGLVYEKPLSLDHNSVLQAIATAEGMAPSPVSSAVYIIGKPSVVLNTLHVGNSLTASTGHLPLYASTLGYLDNYKSFLHGGATTRVVWEDATGSRKEEWQKILDSFEHVDHFTMQPRDFDLEREHDYELRFLGVVRNRWPQVQPWLYAEWVEYNRRRPTDLGSEKSPQMSKTWPAPTWEESMSAMVLYVEDLQKKLNQEADGKAVRIIPSALAMGWMHHLIDSNQVPGMKPGSFHDNLFADSVHPNAEGQYLVDLTWLCAFTGQPVKGAVPVNTDLTEKQAAIMQNLAWSAVNNYTNAGWFNPGKKRVALPIIKRISTDKSGTTCDITSKTRGAWFRYTLDGSEPTRDHGYVYCGTVTVPADGNLKVVAYKNGMADSKVRTLQPAPTIR